MSAADRAYRLLLRAYPAGFRAAYGREMMLVFRDQRRQRGAKGVDFWAAVLWDVARSAPPLRAEAFRAGWGKDIQLMEGKMKTMAILAILAGALLVLNAFVELWAGGIRSGDGYSVAWGVIGVVGGLLLAVAGLALARRSPKALAPARGATIICLLVFVAITVVHPRLSIFATLLGIGFPILLLLFLYWTRRRGPSMPTMA